MIDPTIAAIWFCATMLLSVYGDLAIDTTLRDPVNRVSATDLRSRLRTAANRLLRR